MLLSTLIGLHLHMLRRLLITFCCILLASVSCARSIDIMIKGVDKQIEGNIRKRLDLLTTQNAQPQLAVLRQKIPEQVKHAMRPYGYFHPKINMSSRPYRKQTILTLTIDPGSPLILKQLDLQIIGPGKNYPAFTQLLANSRMVVGKRFIVPEYNRTKMGFFHIAESLGFIKAKLGSHFVKINTEQNTAEVKLIFYTGSKYYFGDITFKQQTLDNELLKRYVLFKPGEPFSIKRLLKFQDALRSSVYFKRVNVEWDEHQSKNYRIPIVVKLEPSDNKLYTMGVGYGTDTRIRGTFSFEKRRVNRQGHRFQSRLQASTVQSSLQARYIIPGRYPPTDEYQFFTSAVRYRLRQNDSLSTIIGASYLNHWREWTRTLNLNYLIEWRRSRPGSSALTSRWLYPSVNLRKIHAKDPINTKNGYRINLNFQGAHNGVFAHDSFLRALIEFKYILSKGKWRLITRESIGMISINNIDNLAAHFQFYAGGAQSVRGYQFQSLGPGKYLHIASIESQYQIIDKWRIATYFDAGNANNQLLGQWKRGIGIGLVRSTPIGSIEVGVARPLDSKNKGLSLVFSLGPDLA